MPSLNRVVTWVIVVVCVALATWALVQRQRPIAAQIVAIGGGLAVVGLAVVSELVVPSAVSIPYPTGEYIVGRTEFELERRGWSALAFYPARGSTTAARYLRDASVASKALGVPTWFFRHLESTRLPVQEGAEPLPPTRGWAIYLHGAASFPEDQSSLLAELASHGYTVLAPRLNLDVRSLGLAVRDELEFVAAFARAETSLFPSIVEDLFASIVTPAGDRWNVAPPDPNRNDEIVVIGHSLGAGLSGALAVRLMKVGFRVPAWINLDGHLLAETPRVPQLHLSQGVAFNPEHEPGPIVADYKERVERAHRAAGDRSHWFRIPNAGHASFTDLPHIMRGVGPLAPLVGTDRSIPTTVQSLILHFILESETDWWESASGTLQRLP